MTRTFRYKLGYAAGLAIYGVVAIGAIVALGGGALAMLIVGAVLLVPGRLLGFAYRDLFRGRRLLDMRQAKESIPNTLQFLDYIRQHPGRKRLLWLAWSIYTLDAEAMALNNLGAAHLESGDMEAATEALKAAIVVDAEYPLPYYNLAIERAIAEDETTAARYAAEAERLGYRGTGIDGIIRQAQSMLACMES